MEFSETESDPVLAKDRYVGNVILSVPSTDHIPLLTAAFVNIRDGAPQLLNRVRLTVDNEGDNTNSVIEKLSVFGRYIAYGSGSTLQSDKYVEGIKVAHSRFVPVTYVWTIDEPNLIEKYMDVGVSAIVSDHPLNVTSIANKRRLLLAKPGDLFTCF